MNRYLHYSSDPFLGPLRSFDESMANSKWTASKPAGLWITTDGDDGWAAWCRGNEFRVDSLAYCFEVWLRPSARILRIASELALYEFDAKYSEDDRFLRGIRWYELVEHYDGIIIDPYQFGCRYGLHWYYGWDCASGVIWDVQCIASTTLLEVPAPHMTSSGHGK